MNAAEEHIEDVALVLALARVATDVKTARTVAEADPADARRILVSASATLADTLTEVDHRLTVLRHDLGPFVIVRIENTYSDGHTSTRHEELDAPDVADEQWWQDAVFPLTGDGHGAEIPGLGSHSIATIVATDRRPSARLIGRTHEWTD